MRQLLPIPLDPVDPLDCYLADERPMPTGRPWLMLNMIASVDGATALDGTSGALGGPADKAVFRAIRACCDVVLVASGTATAERYRVPRSSDDVRDRRAAAHRSAAPLLAIVTASGNVDPTLPAFRERDESDAVPLVIAGSDADGTALARLDAEVVMIAEPRPDPTSILRELAQRDAAVVLAEGGPRFNGLLHRAAMIDELCLSVSPTLVGGDSGRIIGDAGEVGPQHAVASAMRLDRLLEHDDLLFARYLRR